MKRLNYIDGLKGFCAISVCLFHFLLAFYIEGYVGWKCMIEGSIDPNGYYFEHFPYSILTNNSFPLYIFFAIIALLICLPFFKNKDEGKLKKQAILRYFRFLPIVFLSCLVAYLFFVFDVCKFKEFYEITKNEWIYARVIENLSFFDFLKETLFISFVKGTNLVSPLWCLHYLYLGSMLTYFVMLVYNKINRKWLFFTLLFIFFFFVDPNYLSFLVGIIVALIINKEIEMKKIYGILLIILGCVFGLFPVVLIPEVISVYTFYAIGALFVLLGTHASFKNNAILNNKFLGFLGKESLTLIVIQFLVLQSVNVNLYVLFSSSMKEYINVLINFVINGVLSLGLTYVYSKIVTPLTNMLCNKLGSLIIKNN